MKNSKTLILNKIKLHYGFKSDAEFARFLEIKPNSLANWYSRNTMDYERVFSKCEDIDANWIFTGEGEMLRRYKIENENSNIAPEDSMTYGESYWKGRYDELLNQYEKIKTELSDIKSSSAS